MKIIVMIFCWSNVTGKYKVMNFNREVQQIMKISVLKSFGYIVYDLM